MDETETKCNPCETCGVCGCWHCGYVCFCPEFDNFKLNPKDSSDRKDMDKIIRYRREHRIKVISVSNYTKERNKG